MITKPYPLDPDLWVCECGNEACLEGFQLIDKDGEFVDFGDDNAAAYKCGRCGLIYSAEGKEVSPLEIAIPGN